MGAVDQLSTIRPNMLLFASLLLLLLVPDLQARPQDCEIFGDCASEPECDEIFGDCEEVEAPAPLQEVWQVPQGSHHLDRPGFRPSSNSRVPPHVRSLPHPERTTSVRWWRESDCQK